MTYSLRDRVIIIIGIFIYSIFYILASYGYNYWDKNNKSFQFIYIISIILGIISYMIKVPLFYFFDKQNMFSTYILYLSISSIVMVIFSIYVLKEEVPITSYIVLLLVFLLVCFNEYLLINKNKR